MKAEPSPVDERFEAKVIDDFPTSDIHQGYLQTYQVDIRPFINSERLKLFRCNETGLKFFRGIDPGDGPFYARLMENEWYYDPWKWEHEQICNLLHSDSKVLEIGCGSGGFLDGIKSKTNRACGIELNDAAVARCKEKGLNVERASLEDYARQFTGQFDWVVTFQVLEHIREVGAFLRDAVKLLKPGGRLVISVPNNDSFIGKAEDDWLNFPPHHMNRWDAHSLQKICPTIGCHLDFLLYEPLQEYHRDWYINTALAASGTSLLRLPPPIRGITYRMVRKVFSSWVTMEADNIKGHTIIGLYTKHADAQ